MRRQRRSAQNLRQAIDCLPVRTREAMLEGLAQNEIIVGAYTDRDGRVCPMLAAHRNGGRTSLASFARAWDRYTDVGKSPRPASARELRTLTAMLEFSLMADDEQRDLAAAARAHSQSRRRNEASTDERGRSPRRATGERNRAPELRGKLGWAWLRIFRRYDDYEAAVSAAQREDASGEPRELSSVN